MSQRTVTERESQASSDPDADNGAAPAGGPGLVLLFSVDEPRHVVLNVPAGGIVLGRDMLAAHGVHDTRISREHLRISHDGEGFLFVDLGSTNGSFLNGTQIRGSVTASRRCPGSTDDDDTGVAGVRPDPVLRVGRTVLLAVEDMAPYQRHPSIDAQSGLVLGPAMQEVYARISLLAKAGGGLLLSGESGVGKELAAQCFHRATGRPQGPLVAVNCATIPRELAERLLFGARRGAYSGAIADADGYIQAASGGTLFLDELGELEPNVQAKLLRVLETRELFALGATRSTAVDIRWCAATMRNLQAEVTAGRFREDLYYRVARPEVRIPPLRERMEEVPFLIARALGSMTPRAPMASAALIEACLLRPWPGNVRELLKEVSTAALCAIAAGSQEVTGSHLDERAGRSLSERPPAAPRQKKLDAGAIAAALRRAGGNLTAAAQELGVPRTTLRRMAQECGLDLTNFREDAPTRK